MIRWLYNAGPVRRLRVRLLRGLSLLVAVAVAAHGIARFLVTEHRDGGTWLYLGLSIAVAVAVLLVTRAGSRRRIESGSPAPTPADRQDEPRRRTARSGPRR